MINVGRLVGVDGAERGEEFRRPGRLVGEFPLHGTHDEVVAAHLKGTGAAIQSRKQRGRNVNGSGHEYILEYIPLGRNATGTSSNGSPR